MLLDMSESQYVGPQGFQYTTGVPQLPQDPPQLPAASPGPARGFAVSALMVGIVGFLMGLLPVVGALVGATAVVLGIVALNKKQPKAFAVTGLVLGGLGLISSIGMTAGLGAISRQVPAVVQEAETAEPTKKEEVTPPPEPTPEPAPVPVPAPGPELTLGQMNAIRSAEQYLNFTAFSRTGLIGQLEFEGFSTADAEVAVDSVGADWNAQAAASAQSYLDFTSFSRQGLIDQLVFEGFTPEQAEYGVTAVGY